MTQERAALSPQLQPSQVTKTEPKLETIAQANQPFPIIQTPPEPSNIPKIKEKLPTLCDFVKQNIQPPHPKTTKVLNPKQQDISLYERVHRKKLYLCAYAPDEWSPNILIEINFLDDKVTFTPLQGKVMAKEEKYKVQNERIYISQDGTYDDEMYKTIEKITDNYYLLTTWIGTRKLTSIRYYFDLEKAKQYLATLR
jgi:hypothetical protein